MESKSSFLILIFLMSSLMVNNYSIKALEVPAMINETVNKVSALFKTRVQPDNSSTNSFMLLMPAELTNLTNSLKDLDFSLLKLNTDFLFGNGSQNEDTDSANQELTISTGAQDEETNERGARSERSKGELLYEKTAHRRETRALKLFNGLWNKKPGPLYLVNGTVCRFISNAQPICTTLQTKGLIRKYNQLSSEHALFFDLT